MGPSRRRQRPAGRRRDQPSGATGRRSGAGLEGVMTPRPEHVSRALVVVDLLDLAGRSDIIQAHLQRNLERIVAHALTEARAADTVTAQAFAASQLIIALTAPPQRLAAAFVNALRL